MCIRDRVGLRDRDVHLEALVLHRVERVVLGAGHDPLLHASGEGGTQLAELVRLVGVRLLDPAPRRMAREVDADASEEVATHGSYLGADRLADTLLEVDVPRRT